MLTARGWWFLLIVVFVLVIGAFVIPNYTAVPAILAVTLLAWFIWEWLQFHTKSNAAVSRLRVRRWVMQGGRDTPMLWANVPFEVRVRVRHDGFVTIDYAVVEDRLPTGADTLDGDTGHHTTIGVGEPADVIYTLKCPAPGVLRFEGVKVRVADLNGFFYRRVFLRDPIEFLVLPPLVSEEGRQRADKRFNILPPPGIHRLRRPGSGDELHDLRDYQPGDPPKMIAWKTSAQGQADHEGVRERRAGAVRAVPRHQRGRAPRPAGEHAADAHGRRRRGGGAGQRRQPRPRRPHHLRHARGAADAAGARRRT